MFFTTLKKIFLIYCNLFYFVFERVERGQREIEIDSPTGSMLSTEPHSGLSPLTLRS